MNKMKEVEKVSNPSVVYHKAMILLNEYNDVEMGFSTRKSKKYMIKGEFTNDKWIHFGDINYQDYTLHRDEDRRGKFLKRNAHWIEDYDKYSPAWFSYHLLW